MSDIQTNTHTYIYIFYRHTHIEEMMREKW